MHTTAVPMARIISTMPMEAEEGAAARGAGEGLTGAGAAAGFCTDAVAEGAAAVPAGATGAAAAGAAAAVLGAADGAGILMVGAEVGFGGRLIRTVSFLGWILAASAGLGGKESAGAGDDAGVGVSGAAGGRFGLFSAINVGTQKWGRGPVVSIGFF